ncbi:MAG: hypothetical protein RR473_01565 [Comamonas sp.]
MDQIQTRTVALQTALMRSHRALAVPVVQRRIFLRLGPESMHSRPAMHTPSSTPLQLSAAQTASLHLSEGSEVFCRQGPLRLSVAPLAFADNCFEQIMLLQTGQSWRAPAATWVQLMAAAETAGLEIHERAAVQSMQQSRPGRLWGGLAAWLARLQTRFVKRERRAA